MPYTFLEEIATADVAFEAWGNTREEMFIAGAEALLGTMVAKPAEVASREELVIRLEEAELDLLLFSFLQELVFYKDARGLLLHAARVCIDEHEGGFGLEGVVRGEKIDAGRHLPLVDVKAVTLHRLRVVLRDALWTATVVLDV